jgi:hypothetical protein
MLVEFFLITIDDVLEHLLLASFEVAEDSACIKNQRTSCYWHHKCVVCMDENLNLISTSAVHCKYKFSLHSNCS